MGMTIDTPLIAYSEQTDEIYVIDEKGKYCVTDKVMKAVVATNRAIPKADYENRLKADMAAILEKLKSEIEELQGKYSPYYDEASQHTSELIQQKINALMERGNDGNND